MGMRNRCGCSGLARGGWPPPHLLNGLPRVLGHDAVQVGLVVHDLLGLHASEGGGERQAPGTGWSVAGGACAGIYATRHGCHLALCHAMKSGASQLRAPLQHGIPPQPQPPMPTWISMSTAAPEAPPRGWWIMMRALGIE